VSQWLIQGETALFIATSLAAAGLTQDEASALVERVKTEQAERLEELRRERRAGAKRLFLVGAIMFVGLIVLGVLTRAPYIIIFYGPVLAGLTAWHRMSQPSATIPRKRTANEM